MKPASSLGLLLGLAGVAASFWCAVGPGESRCRCHAPPDPEVAEHEAPPRTNGPKPCTPEELTSRATAQSQVIILVDSSGTFRHTPAFLASLAALEPLTSVYASTLPQPLTIRVAEIGVSTPNSPPICDMYFGTAGGPFGATCAELMPAAQAAKCVADVKGVGNASFTEISHAIANAQLMLGNDGGEIRHIIVMSDMEEDLSPGKPSVNSDLTGSCILLITAMKAGDTIQELSNREYEWMERLRSQGAEVSKQPLAGLKPALALDFLRDCGKKLHGEDL